MAFFRSHTTSADIGVDIQICADILALHVLYFSTKSSEPKIFSSIFTASSRFILQRLIAGVLGKFRGVLQEFVNYRKDYQRGKQEAYAKCMNVLSD